MLNDFKKFILRGNVIDLAVAVVIGTAFGAIIKSLVADIITPLIAAIGGKPDFSNLYFTIHHSKFMYGDFINAIINKLVTFSARNKQTADPDDKVCPECLSTVPVKATRCAFCTTKLKV
jgi:large conductance mechanosensitive channel